MQRRAAQPISLLALLLVMTLGISTRGQKDSQSNVPKLPLPSGPFAVGRVSFDWIDPNRAPDMAEDRGPHSELMVYLWYPTEATRRNQEHSVPRREADRLLSGFLSIP